MSRVVVTGATGNVGTAVVRVLTLRGHDVVGVARRPPAAAPHGSAHAEWVSIDLAEGDGTLPLRALVSDADAVIHLAWAFQPMRRRAYLRRACVETLDRVVRTTLAHSEAHLIHVSSVAAYTARRSERLVDESWPRDGIAGATYSQLKVEAERVLEARTRQYGATERVTVARPCLIGQRPAGGPMLRCGSPAWLPGKLIRHVPLVPVDERFGLQMVHADDVAEALVRILEQRESGAFNLAADGIVRGEDIARILRAPAVTMRQEVVRQAVAAAWHTHLNPLDPGWVDMALQAPWVDSRRARSVLGWRPAHSACDVLEELVQGMVTGAGGADTGALRPRTGTDGLRRALSEGPVAHRTRT